MFEVCVNVLPVCFDFIDEWHNFTSSISTITKDDVKLPVIRPRLAINNMYIMKIKYNNTIITDQNYCFMFMLRIIIKM
jgi:hypothetical protein